MVNYSYSYSLQMAPRQVYIVMLLTLLLTNGMQSRAGAEALPLKASTSVRTSSLNRNLLINPTFPDVDWTSMRFIVSLEFVAGIAGSPVLLCSGTIIALSTSSAAVITAPGCLPAATRGAQTANNDWVGKGPIVVTGVTSVRAGNLLHTQIGKLSICSFVWSPGVDGGELAICEVALDINNVSSVGGLDVARWADAASFGKRAAKEVKPGDPLSVFGFGPSSVISNDEGSLTVGVGAGMLRGAQVTAALAVGGAGTQHSHCVVVGTASSGALIISASSPLIAGEPRFCTSVGSGDAGAPLFSIEDGGGLRLAGVAISSSGAETSTVNEISTHILCSEKTTRFTSTVYRDSWIRSALQRTAPEASINIRAEECPSLTPTPTISATITSTRIFEAVIPPTSTPTSLPSTIPQTAVIVVAPMNFLSIGISLGIFGCFCCGIIIWVRRIRAKVVDGQAEHTRLRNALTGPTTTQTKTIRKGPAWYGIDMTYYQREKEKEGENADEGQVELGEVKGEGTVCDRDGRKATAKSSWKFGGGAMNPKSSMRTTIPTPVALLRAAQRAERLKQEQNAANAVTLVACEAVNAAPFGANVRSLNGGLQMKNKESSAAVAWVAEREARTINVRAKAMAARQATEAAATLAAHQAATLATEAAATLAAEAAATLITPPTIPQLNLSSGEMLKQHITTLNNADNIIDVKTATATNYRLDSSSN